MRGVKCFDQEAGKHSPYITVDAGLRVIEVNRITGSVNKCHELDRKFRTRRRRDRRERWRRGRFTGTSLQFHSLPPIDAYLLSGEYYVIDGNRRVAAAIEHGLEFMDAHVTECVAHADRDGHRGAVSRRLFEQQTGLKNVRLDYTSGYADLLAEARRYAGEQDIAECGRRWYNQVYRPRLEAIGSSELKRRYDKLREADLYLLVTRFYRDLMGRVPDEVDFDTVISAFLFARRLPRRRLFRRFPLRQLYLALRGRVPAALESSPKE